MLTSATHALTPGFLVRAGKEIAEGLEDAVAENREECVRCLGAFLHLAASVQLGSGEAEVAGLGRAVGGAREAFERSRAAMEEGLDGVEAGCMLTIRRIEDALSRSRT